MSDTPTIDALGNPQESPDVKPTVAYDDLLKLDLRVGLVLSAERVPKSDKLIKMQVSFGTFERQILAGVGKTFEPTALVAQSFVFILNLAPRKMMGIESHGMMFAAGPVPDRLALIQPVGVAPAPGTAVG